MLIFTVLLGIMTGILWLVPKYGASKNRDLIALRSSGTGCLSLIAAGLLAVLAVLLLRLPYSILVLFVIAFFTLPLIAGLLSAFIAVKTFRRVGGEGGAPTVRAILYYLLLGVIGITVWFGEKCIEMRKVRETWSVEYPVPVSGIRRVAVTQQLVNPVIEKYDGSLLVTDEKGEVRSTALLRDRFDGRHIVNLYELNGIPSVPGRQLSDAGSGEGTAAPRYVRKQKVRRGSRRKHGGPELCADAVIISFRRCLQELC